MVQFLDYDDPRSDSQIAADRRAVARQVASFRRTEGLRAFRLEFDRARMVRRARRDDRPDFAVTTASAGDEVLLAPGHLLVSTSALDQPAVRQMLRGFGFQDEVIEELDNRVSVLTNPELTESRLGDIARLLRGMGVAASVDHVMALAPVAKGLDGGPEPSPGAGRARDAAGATGSGTIVAVVDTGITAQRRADGWLEAVGRGQEVDPLDDLPEPNGYLDFAAGHGTFVSGVLQQVAPGAELRVYRAMDSDGVGSDVDVAMTLLRAVREGAQIVNLSLGVQTTEGEPPVALQAALDIVAEQHPDVVVVAAAGNDGLDRPTWPAAFRNVVSVAGLTADLRPSDWSNCGPWVDCSTVAEGIVSTYVEGRESVEVDPDPDVFPADSWAVWSGTSFAAPQIAGLLARTAQEEGVSAPEAWRKMVVGTRRIPGFGRVIPVLRGT